MLYPLVYGSITIGGFENLRLTKKETEYCLFQSL